MPRSDNVRRNKEELTLPLSQYAWIASQTGSSKLFSVLFEVYLFNRRSRKPVSYGDLTAANIKNSLFEKHIKSEADFFNCVDVLAEAGIMHRTGSCAVVKTTRRNDFFNQCPQKYLDLKGEVTIDLLTLKSKMTTRGYSLPYILSLEVIRAVKGGADYSIGFYSKLTGVPSKRLKKYVRQGVEDAIITKDEATKVLLSKHQKNQLKNADFHHAPIQYGEVSGNDAAIIPVKKNEKYKANKLFVEQGRRFRIKDLGIVRFSPPESREQYKRTKSSEVINDNASAVFDVDSDDVEAIVDLSGTESKAHQGYLSIGKLYAEDFVNGGVRFVFDQLKFANPDKTAVLDASGDVCSLQQFVRRYL